ncbi:MAG: oxidoreductase [Isosphaeraceae bacterium]|jgi:NAD(P)-dependent dehydrogenase (short-subunit alcohol dehydrogenase family)|nr:MAG: oxidoreductase [Isosphaeraceae bacterium]
MNLHDKVAVVTGADSGIGAEIVRLYLEAGARVVAVDINPMLPQSALKANERYAANLRCLVGDVALEQTALDYVEMAVREFGRLDVMVNNAAIPLQRPIHETTAEQWDRVMDVNVKSLFWSARAVVPVMKRQGGGLILNTGSISSVVGIPGQGAYAASKGAVAQITRQMAIEYAADGIRVNAVCPGTVDTPLLRRAAVEMGDADAFLKSLSDAHPIGRVAASEEIAQFFVFLASDHARFFTGALLMIDGGFTAH